MLPSESTPLEGNPLTLGPVYNEFGYNEHPAITSNFSLRKKALLIDINVKNSPVTTSTTYNEEIFCELSYSL